MLKILLKTVRWLLTLGLLSLAFLLLAAPFYTYNRFNSELAIAELEFDKISELYYLAHLSTGNLCDTHDFPIEGDQWQLDAQFLKWGGSAIMLGFDSRYRLDRLSGRYSDIKKQNEVKSSAFDLSPELLLDLFPSNNQGRDSNESLFIDALYGSSVYMKIDETKRYRVYKTEDALIVRSEARSVPISEGGVLTISITKACETEPSTLANLSKQLNRWVIELL